MPDEYRSRSALAHRGLAARAAADAGKDAGVVLAERPMRAQVVLRGDGADPGFADDIVNVVDVAPPTDPNAVAGPTALADGPRILWLGPDEWLIVGASADGPDLPAALRAIPAGQQRLLKALIGRLLDGRAGRLPGRCRGAGHDVRPPPRPAQGPQPQARVQSHPAARLSTAKAAARPAANLGHRWRVPECPS